MRHIVVTIWYISGRMHHLVQWGHIQVEAHSQKVHDGILRSKVPYVLSMKLCTYSAFSGTWNQGNVTRKTHQSYSPTTLPSSTSFLQALTCFSASALSIRNRSTYFAPSFTLPLTSSTFSFISWSSSSRACIFSSCASAWAVAAAIVSRGWGWICRNRLSWSLASRICWARVAASFVRAFALI